MKLPLGQSQLSEDLRRICYFLLDDNFSVRLSGAHGYDQFLQRIRTHLYINIIEVHRKSGEQGAAMYEWLERTIDDLNI